MSPPKVSLAGKDVPKPVEAEEDTSDEKVEGPAVITVENARYFRINRAAYNRRRSRRVILGASIVIFIALAALGTMALVHRMRRHHRKHWSVCYGPKRLNENVEVDHGNKLIRVRHDHDEDTKTPAMEILHEYRRGMVAYKDVDRKICYIDRLDETFESGYERWEAYEHHDRRDEKSLRVISEPIKVEVMRHILDIHITAHCQDSKSVWVMEIERKEITTEMTIVHV